MANTTALFRGSVVGFNFYLLAETVAQTKPTNYRTSYNTWRGSVDLIGAIPEGATVKSVRCDSGLDVISISGNSSYTEGGYSNLLTPEGSVYGNFNNATLASYIEEYGISTIYYRVGVEIRSNDWQQVPTTSTEWYIRKDIDGYFRPWFEITYAFSGVEHKIKFATFSPTTGNGSWQRASTYAPVQTPDGVKWYESEVRYCMVPVEWSDIPLASEEEQPPTTAYLPVGLDVERKLLEGFTGTNATVGRRVRGNDRYRCFTIHNAPAGTYTVRFTCSYTCKLLRISHDGDVEAINITYRPGDVHEYTITTTTTDFLGFTFIMNSSTEAETFEVGLGEATGEPEWVLCGEEA